MHINLKNYYSVPRFQEGGVMGAEEAPMPEEQAPMAPEEAAAPEQGGGDPLMQIAELAMQALQNQDCQAAMAVCQGFIQLIQQAQGGAEAAPQGEPVYRAGGKLSRRI